MEIMGIKFAPLNIPFSRRLQTLAAACWFMTFAFGGFISIFFTIYLMFTSYRWITLLYLVWALVLDKETSERGGRRWEWVRDWTWWKYFRDYFPIKFERVPWVELDPKRNYLFCCFPHGMLSAGPFSAFGTNVGGFKEHFPNHKPHVLTLSQHFKTPFFRELALSLGGCSASANSINWLLGSPGGGRVAVLIVGGAAESYYCRPGQYRIVLKNRKGFVRLALKNGSPLVPVISFGETDLYDQPDYPDGSLLHNIQEKLRKVIGIAPAIPLGRGLFQYTFGIVPHRKPVTTVVGVPIEVEKVEEPSREEIDKLHETFMKQLTLLFEEQKHHYLANPEKTFLEIM